MIDSDSYVLSTDILKIKFSMVPLKEMLPQFGLQRLGVSPENLEGQENKDEKDKRTKDGNCNSGSSKPKCILVCVLDSFSFS